MKTILKTVALILAVLVIAFMAGDLLNSLKATPVITISNSNSTNDVRPYQNQGSSTSSPPSGPVPSSVSTAAQSGNTSSNWAGYVASGDNYTSVSGSWIAPDPTTSNDTSADATWIGIGGVASSDLIQVGTQNVVAPDGQVETSAFYEMLPDTSQTITNVSVNPGDSVSASLDETSSGQWTITITDNTNGNSFSTLVSYGSSLSSAEWIEEDPSDGYSQIPLDNFGSVSFSNCLMSDNGASLSLTTNDAQAITMADSFDQTLVSVSGVSNGSFSTTRTSASTLSSISQFNAYPNQWARHGIGLDRF